MKKTKSVIAISAIIIIFILFLSNVSQVNLTYYYEPNEVLKSPEKYTKTPIRIMGLVEKGSVSWSPQTTQLSFRITQDQTNFINVQYTGVKPDMFKEGNGVVVEGIVKNQGKKFQANRLLVKHSEEYKVQDHLDQKKSYYKSIIN